MLPDFLCQSMNRPRRNLPAASRAVRKRRPVLPLRLEILEERNLLSAFLPLGPASETAWSQTFLPGGANLGPFSISENSSTSLQTVGPSVATPLGAVAMGLMDVNYEFSIGVYDSQSHSVIGYSFNLSLLMSGLELQNDGLFGGGQGANSNNAEGSGTSTPLFPRTPPGGHNGNSGGGGPGKPLPPTPPTPPNGNSLSANAGPAESGNVGSAISFDGSATGGIGSDSYSWNFGDGTAPVTGTLTPTHTYAAAGDYTVTLIVTDSHGDTSTSTTKATVHDLTVNAGGPYSGIAGSPISFTASASDPTDTSGNFTYTWNFGDGTTASGANVSHTYATAGSYTATVTVTEPDGATASTNVAVTVSGSSTGAPNEPLLYSSNLQYVGAFRVPDIGGDGTSIGFGYANGALAYDPANNGLFIVGYDPNGGQPIAEISIPQAVNSSNINDLNTSTVLQPFTEPLNNLPQPQADVGSIGGLLVQNGQLLGTEYAYYSGADTQTDSVFTLSSLNLSTATVNGLYPVDGRLSAGYLTPIPSEWQGVLGYPDLIGQADLSIIDTVSSGPAALGFNPSDLNYSTAAPNTVFLDYPTSNQLGPYTGAVDPLQNGTTGVMGAVFAPGTSSVLFFGVTGTNYISYGPPGAEAPWSLNGQYALQVWAYNANDFLAVEQGTMQPDQVQPYDVWNFTLPIMPPNLSQTGGQQYVIGGVAFNPNTDQVYVSLLGADTEAAYTYLPLIEVFQVNVPSAPPAAMAPQIGTLAATPSPVPSPIPAGWGASVSAGTSVTLTAGNVYALTPGASITQVAFYLSPNGGTTFNPGSDQLLGDGTPSTIANAQNNYTLTMSTAGLTAGTYTLFVQATDSDGQVSNVVETTLTIS